MSCFTPANLMTLARIPLALGLLFTMPLSPRFFLLYTLAGITDTLCAALCLLASVSAGEELTIQCLCGETAPDCKSIFHLLKSRG